MLNIGPQELIVILIVALVVVGPQRLPELGRSIGKALREFRKIQDDVKDTLRFDLSDDPKPNVAPRPNPHVEPNPHVDANGSSGSPAGQPLVAADPITPVAPVTTENVAAPDPQDRPAPDVEPPAAE